MNGLAYTMMPGRGDTDLLLSNFAEKQTQHGVRVCGCVQNNVDKENSDKCDMFVRTIPAGEVFLISQDLGAESSGCRLDPDALERAVASVSKAFEEGCDLLIVNKFGKHEATGGGFRELIAEALYREVPVIVGVNKLNHDAFMEFCGGEAKFVEPKLDALRAWSDAIAASEAA